jgi:hypothetical protein
MQIAGEQDPPAEARPRLSQPVHDPVVEAVDRVALRGRPLIEDREQRTIIGRWKALHLDPHFPVPHQIQYLGEQWNHLAVGDAELPSLGERELGDRTDPRDIWVMVDYDPAVSSRVDIQLYPVGVEHHRPSKGGTRVLVFVSGSTAVGDYTGASHRLR